MSFNDAKKQFGDNLARYGDPHNAPEKFNLYAGLGNIAAGLTDLEYTVQQLQRELRELREEK